MATAAKSVKPGKSLAKSKVQLPANWDAEMKKAAQAYKDKEANTGGGQFLSIRGGVLKFDGNPVKDSRFKGVVLESMFENGLYDADFDANNPRPPICFAFGEVEDELAPHKDSHKPQHSDCKTCPHNQFGSAEKGRGKACKNGRRLALLHEDYLKKGGIDKAPVVFLKLPPTSLRGWAAHVKQVANVLELPPYAVVTEVSVSPDDKTQVSVGFEVAGEIKDRKVLAEVYKRHQTIGEEMVIPYQWTETEPQKGAKGAKGASAQKRPSAQKRKY